VVETAAFVHNCVSMCGVADAAATATYAVELAIQYSIARASTVPSNTVSVAKLDFNIAQHALR
jgi:hypothetical protein